MGIWPGVGSSLCVCWGGGGLPRPQLRRHWHDDLRRPYFCVQFLRKNYLFIYQTVTCTKQRRKGKNSEIHWNVHCPRLKKFHSNFQAFQEEWDPWKSTPGTVGTWKSTTWLLTQMNLPPKVASLNAHTEKPFLVWPPPGDHRAIRPEENIPHTSGPKSWKRGSIPTQLRNRITVKGIRQPP